MTQEELFERAVTEARTRLAAFAALDRALALLAASREAALKQLHTLNPRNTDV